MSHSAAHTAHTTQPTAKVTATSTRDTGADAQKLLLFLAADWLNGDRTHSREIGALLASITAAAGPPAVVDVPAVTQSGSTLSCTMGNWTGEPTGYAYAWHRDGVAIEGATAATYAVQAADSGHALACVVTATNALGSTAAPMSNAVAVT